MLSPQLLALLRLWWKEGKRRCDPVNPPLLGMRKVVSEDSVRRNLEKIDEAQGLA